MIIIGYQGIGKSTLGQEHKGYIDLESSSFYVNGERAADWYIPYCQVAEHLSKQGYVVFTSSHEEVRNFLKDSEEKVCCCFPNLDLRDQWVEKLRHRYCNTNLEKDYRAYINAVHCYSDDITALVYSGFQNIVIDSLDYTLEKVIRFAFGIF